MYFSLIWPASISCRRGPEYVVSGLACKMNVRSLFWGMDEVVSELLSESQILDVFNLFNSRFREAVGVSCNAGLRDFNARFRRIRRNADCLLPESTEFGVQT
jgi:hypothetical protein